MIKVLYLSMLSAIIPEANRPKRLEGMSTYKTGKSRQGREDLPSSVENSDQVSRQIGTHSVFNGQNSDVGDGSELTEGEKEYSQQEGDETYFCSGFQQLAFWCSLRAWWNSGLHRQQADYEEN